RGGMAGALAAAGAARLLAAGIVLVDRGPGAPLGFLLADALLLVTFLDVLGLALLLVGVFRLAALGHERSPYWVRGEARPMRLGCSAGAAGAAVSITWMRDRPRFWKSAISALMEPGEIAPAAMASPPSSVLATTM